MQSVYEAIGNILVKHLNMPMREMHIANHIATYMVGYHTICVTVDERAKEQMNNDAFTISSDFYDAAIRMQSPFNCLAIVDNENAGNIILFDLTGNLRKTTPLKTCDEYSNTYYTFLKSQKL